MAKGNDDPTLKIDMVKDAGMHIWKPRVRGVYSYDFRVSDNEADFYTLRLKLFDKPELFKDYFENTLEGAIGKDIRSGPKGSFDLDAALRVESRGWTEGRVSEAYFRNGRFKYGFFFDKDIYTCEDYLRFVQETVKVDPETWKSLFTNSNLLGEYLKGVREMLK